MNEELAEELEALKYTYLDELLIDDRPQVGEGDVSFTLVVSPTAAMDRAKRFVEATVRVLVGRGYPEVAPVVEVVGSKGLGEERVKAYKERLQVEAKALEGELMLGQICVLAFEMLTELNTPEGSCSVCLDLLVTDGMVDDNDLIKLECYHTFHNWGSSWLGKLFTIGPDVLIRVCFSAWWTFQQKDLVRQENEMRERAGAEAASRIEHLPKKSGNMFVVNCPVCRAPIEPSYLEEDLQFAVYDVDNSGWGNQGSVVVPIDDLLPSDLVPKLRCQQEVWKEQMTAQGQRGGTVNSNVVTLSLSTLPPETLPTETVAGTEADFSSKEPLDTTVEKKDELAFEDKDAHAPSTGSSKKTQVLHNSESSRSRSNFGETQRGRYSGRSRRGRGLPRGRGTWDRDTRQEQSTTTVAPNDRTQSVHIGNRGSPPNQNHGDSHPGQNYPGNQWSPGGEKGRGVSQQQGRGRDGGRSRGRGRWRGHERGSGRGRERGRGRGRGRGRASGQGRGENRNTQSQNLGNTSTINAEVPIPVSENLSHGEATNSITARQNVDGESKPFTEGNRHMQHVDQVP